MQLLLLNLPKTMSCIQVSQKALTRYTVKKGSQQQIKAPTMLPTVLVALASVRNLLACQRRLFLFDELVFLWWLFSFSVGCWPFVFAELLLLLLPLPLRSAFPGHKAYGNEICDFSVFLGVVKQKLEKTMRLCYRRLCRNFKTGSFKLKRLYFFRKITY